LTLLKEGVEEIRRDIDDIRTANDDITRKLAVCMESDFYSKLDRIIRGV
jgi:hypothetical protein